MQLTGANVQMVERCSAIGGQLIPVSRQETTATVHYLKLRFAPALISVFAAQPARIVGDHPNYNAMVELTDEQRAELSVDVGS